MLFEGATNQHLPRPNKPCVYFIVLGVRVCPFLVIFSAQGCDDMSRFGKLTSSSKRCPPNIRIRSPFVPGLKMFLDVRDVAELQGWRDFPVRLLKLIAGSRLGTVTARGRVVCPAQVRGTAFAGVAQSLLKEPGPGPL